MAIQKVVDLYKIIQTAGDTYQGNELDQTYSINPAFVAAGEQIVIIDQGGSNAIELVDGLTIASSIVVADELQLTLSNGAVLNIRGADSFTFDVGSNQAGGVEGQALNFTDFVEQVLGTTIPPEGEISNGGEVTIGDDSNPENDPTDDSININGSTFTLQEVPDVVVDDGGALLWEGISVENFLDFLTNIAGLDIAQLGLIDANGDSTVSGVSNISIGSIDPSAGNDQTNNTITFTLNDGGTLVTEAGLGAEYLAFLSSLIFDANGDSRLTETHEVTADGGGVILTTTENNDGTIEDGFTTSNNDLIVAGRTELLHRAYLDGGLGTNVLQIDMKGVYAQPLQLLNIQQIQVQNLPNVYTDINDESTYPDLSGTGTQSSVLDLSRATDIEHLIVTEGYGTGTDLGSLTIVGIRNGAPVKLEGGFSEDVYLHYGQGLGRAVDLELNLGDTDNFDLFVAHNSNVLNLDSQGSENWLNDGYFGGSLRTLNISGNAALYIEGDLDRSFSDGRPATINASENTAGVDLFIDAQLNVEFIGSQGNDVFKSTFSELVTINDLDGNNSFTTDDSEVVTIVAGDGNQTISSTNSVSVSIELGDGNNTATVSAESIQITTGEGDDSVALGGTAVIGNALSAAANIQIDLGAGNNLLALGNDDAINPLGGLSALTGSTVIGENITLEVNEDSDLHQAALTGITKVVLSGGNLRISTDQFSAIGAANFMVEDSAFGEAAVLTLVLSADMSLSDLGDLTQLSPAIDFKIDVADGTTLTLTAEELHTHIAEDGINVDDVNGYIDNQVVITDAGLTFDAFAQQNGGSGGGTLVSDVDVTIIRSLDGYQRPAQDDLDNTWTVNSDDTPVIDVPDVDVIDGTGIDTIIIEGTADFEIRDSVMLGDDFNLDFSGLLGTATGITISNFEAINATDLIGGQFDANGNPLVDGGFDADGNADAVGVIDNEASWGSIIGNGLAGTRINLELSTDASVGFDDNDIGGFFSSGVDTYVVTNLNGGDHSTIYVCDQTQDVTTLGLQSNYGSTITFTNVHWTTAILAQGDGFADWTGLPKALGNPDTSNVGVIVANYFTDGAQAIVNINNNGVALGDDSTGGTRSLQVEGLTINNADTLTVNVEDGNAVIEMIAGDSVNALVVNSAGDVTIQDTVDNLVDLEVFDASGVLGTFTLDLKSGVNDLSEVVLTGLDAINFSEDAALTISVDQAIAATISTDDGVVSVLNLVDLADQEIDMTAIDVADIGTVIFADVDGVIVVDSATVFGNASDAADSFEILALASDTVVEMSEGQFNQFDALALGSTIVTTDVGASAVTGDAFIASLVLTDLADDASIDLDNVAADADVAIRVVDLVATADLEIINGNATLEVAGGINDLTLADLVAIDAVHFTVDSTLDLTADQIEAIGTVDANGDGLPDAWTVEPGVTVTLNVTDLAGANEIDLNALQDAGINIGTVSILDSNVAETMHSDTTFGGADEIITPTADVNDPGLDDGLEPTVLNMTVAQLLSSAGVISGDSVVNLTGLLNNVDTNGDFVLDAADYDLSAIANAGTLTLADPTVALTAAADFGGFEIQLADGQMIQFATPEQASGTIVTEIMPGTTTAVAWLFDGGVIQIDTTGYDSDINTLFVNEDLVDGINVEQLWNTLPSTISVEVVNSNDIPDVLVSFDRTVIVEALTGLNGMTFDDLAEFQTIRNLTVNLEGNTSVGDLVVDDTVGEGNFQRLTINSYEDRTTIADDNGFAFSPNIVGNISLSATPSNELVDIVLGTGDFNEPEIVDTNGVGSGASALRSGLALEVGVITFGTEGQTDTATLALNGDNDISIAGVDISDTDLTLLHIENNNTADVEIAGVNQDDLGDPIVAADNIYLTDGFVGTAADVLGGGGVDLLQVINGVNDFTEADLTAIEAFHVSANAEVTLTAAQITAIGEGNFTINAGVIVTVNVTELGNAAIDLNVLQDAGFNIGEVSTVEDAGGVVDTELDDATTLGGADQLTILLNDEDNSLVIQAEQYQQITGGNIVEVDSDGTVVNAASVTVTDLDGIADDKSVTDDQQVANINLSTIAVTGAQRLELADVDTAADIEFDAAAVLAGFTVVLDSQGLVVNDLLGQTVRFATAVQAERAIDVIGLGMTDNGTNVVWLFNSITGTLVAGKVNTDGYDVEIGRVWMMEGLVGGQNVEELFTSLSATTIIRVVNEDELNTLLFTQGFDRQVEIESFTNLTVDGNGNATNGDLTFSDIDTNADTAFDFVENLIIDFGGDVTMADLTVSNILFAPVNNDDEFDSVTINSFLADGTGNADYLLPQGVDFGNLQGQVPFPTGANTIGNIQSGSVEFDMGHVVINTGAAGTGGNDLNAGTIFFTDDGDGLIGGGTEAMLDVKGDGTVTIASLNTNDADITGLIINNLAATLNVLGASPAAAVSNTETLVIDTDGDVTLGTIGDVDKPGVVGSDLSSITIMGTGNVNLGVIADIDGTIDVTGTPPISPLGFVLDTTGSTGNITLVLDNATGAVPTLGAAEAWTFGFNGNAGVDVDMTITGDVVFTAGGQLTIDQADTINIEGDVDLSVLGTGLTISDSALDVPAGSTLTLTAAQADGLMITGDGTVEILNLENFPAANLGNIMTAMGDSGTVNAAVDTSDGPDADVDPEAIDLSGAIGVAHVTIAGDGSVSVSGTMGPIDRNDPATPSLADDTVPSFTVGAAATLNLTATQVGDATGGVDLEFRVLAEGSGTVTVSDLATNSNADLSGLTATTVTAVTDTVTFTGNLGTAAVTVNAGEILTAEGSILDGQVIAGPGTLEVDDNGAGDPINVDLSSVTVDFIAFVADANVGIVQFPVLREADAVPVPPVLAQTVTMTSVQADAQTITGANGNAGGVVVVNVDDTVDDDIDGDVDAFDLSGITAGTLTAFINDTVNDMVVFDPATDFGTFDIVITAGDTVTMTGAQADGLTITGVGATLILTDLAGGENLGNINVTDITAQVASGAVDLSTVAGVTAIDVLDPTPNVPTTVLTLNAEQFTELEAGSNNTATDLGFMDSLIVDVEYDLSGTVFAVDLIYDTSGTDEITGSAAGFVQAQADSAANDGSAFINNVLNNVSAVNQTGLGTVLTADSGAVGSGVPVADNFIYDANPSNFFTEITLFFSTDDDKVDLSAFNDSDNTVTTIAANETIVANEVFFTTGLAGDADTVAASAVKITADGAVWTEAAAGTIAYFVIADDDSSAIYKYEQLGADDATISDTELTLIGTVDAALSVTDVIA